MTPTTIMIDNVRYIKEDSIAQSSAGLPYVICRTDSAGVFAGYLQERSGAEVVLQQARRLWYWAGAASLSQAAQEGFSKPTACKFPCEVSTITLLGAVEILSCTETARKSIAQVPVWKA